MDKKNKKEKDKVIEDVKILQTLLSIEEEYGHLTLRNIIDRFKARVKYKNDLLQKQKEKESNN